MLLSQKYIVRLSKKKQKKGGFDQDRTFSNERLKQNVSFSKSLRGSLDLFALLQSTSHLDLNGKNCIFVYSEHFSYGELGHFLNVLSGSHH